MGAYIFSYSRNHIFLFKITIIVVIIRTTSMKSKVIALFNQIAPISVELSNEILTTLKPLQLSQGSFFIQPNEVCDKICFLENGMLVSYHYNEKGNEICNWLMKNGDIVISVYSFFSQNPAEEYIKAIENCTLWYITFAELERLYQKYPEFNYIGRKLTEYYYVKNEQRALFLRKYSTEQRVAHFLNSESEFNIRLNGEQIASYLGMSTEEFYRKRSKILRKT